MFTSRNDFNVCSVATVQKGTYQRVKATLKPYYLLI